MPRFLRANTSLRLGSGLLGLLVLGALFSDFLAPYAPGAQHRRDYFAPPTRIRLVDAEGGWRWPPFVHTRRIVDHREVRYVEDTSRAYPLHFLVDGERYRLLGILPCKVHLFGVDPPARLFLLGSDALGRDVFSRLLRGSQVSLTIAAVALFISFPLGLVIGSISGFYGGKLDFVFMRLTELFLALPALYLVIALRSALPLNLPPERVFLAMVTVIALFGWANLARVVRGMVLSLRERAFVLAAVALGASDLRIIVRHILPHLAGFSLVQAALAVPGYILAEVTLSYLGLGIQEPLPSWGNMLAVAHNVQVLTSFWWNLAPGVAIFAASSAFHLLAEGLRESSDPRLSRAAVPVSG